MFKNKRIYQRDEILKWLKKDNRISKTKLARKLGVSRPTLDKLLKTVNDDTFTEYKRIVANNRICNEIRNRIFSETIDFLDSINSHREETVFLPTFRVLKPYIDKETEVSLRTFQEILKENNFYLPSCQRKTKRVINKRIRDVKNPGKQLEIIEKFEEIKIKRLYKKKMYPFGDTVEIDACVHPWFNDEKVHLYRAVDAGTGFVLSEWVEKEETSMGYIVLLRRLFTDYGRPRLIVADKRKSFWNGSENKSKISIIINTLDIEIITSSDPTAKPNVERSFKDSQQWLPLALFQRGVKDIPSFNKVLRELTKEHNIFFRKERPKESSFLAISKEEIDANLNLWMFRKTTNGNTISINGTHYIPVKDGKRILFEENATIKVLANELIGMHVIWRGLKVKLEPISDKYMIDHASKEWDKLEFEKNKQKSVNKMLDLKMIKLEKKEKQIIDLIKYLKKEKEHLNAL